MLRGSLDRESLRLGVVRLKTAEQRLAWLADHLAEQPGSGIVYCLTVAATQEVADYLRARGHAVAAYSGQTEPTERLALEQDLLDGEVKALVATSALGMGFDAPLGFVVNLGAPASPVAYYQQVGRAGRGTEDATVVLLPAIEDRDIWAYFASLAFPREPLVRATLDALAEHGPLSTAALETYVDLNRTRLETMLKVLDVDGAVRRVRGGWEATGRSGSTTRSATGGCARPASGSRPRCWPTSTTRAAGWSTCRRSSTTPAAGRCGRCDNCGGFDAVRRGRAHPPSRRPRSDCPGPGVALEPRKMWPTALANLGLDLKGKIADGAAEGRAVARLTDLGHGQRAARAVRRRGRPGPGAAGPGRGRGARPTGSRSVEAIVHVESATRPTLTARPRRRAVALPRRTGGRAVRDRRPRRRAGRGAANSAQRVAAVDAALRARRRACPPARCCWSTTWSSLAGRSRWRRARCGRPGPPRCCRSPSGSPDS